MMETVKRSQRIKFMNDYVNNLKFGIFETVTHSLGPQSIGCVFPVNKAEMVAVTMKEMTLFEGDEIKAKARYNFACACYIPEVTLIVGHTYRGCEFFAMQTNDISNPILSHFPSEHMGVYHMIYSSKSHVIITVGTGIKVWNISWVELGKKMFSSNAKVIISLRASFANNYETPILNPPVFDYESERLFLPTSEGIQTFSIDGIPCNLVTGLPADTRTIFTYCPVNKKVITFDISSGVCIWKKDGKIEKRVNTVGAAILSLAFIDPQNIVYMNSQGSLFIMNIKSGSQFHCYESTQRPTRFFLTKLYHKPIIALGTGSVLKLLDIVVPWKVWNLNISKPKIVDRYSKFEKAARILIHTDNSFVKLYSPRNRKQINAATPNTATTLFSSFYDRGVFIEYKFDQEKYEFTENVIQTIVTEPRDHLFVTFDNGFLSIFDCAVSPCVEKLSFKLNALFVEMVMFQGVWCYAIGRFDGGVSILDYMSYEVLKTIPICKDKIYGMKYHYASNCLLFLLYHNMVLLDLKSCQIVDNMRFDFTEMARLHGDILYLGYKDGDLMRYNISDKCFKPLSYDSLKPHTAQITSFGFGKKYYMSSSLDNTFMLWDYAHNKITQVFVPFPLYSVSFLGPRREILLGLEHEVMIMDSSVLFGEEVDPEIKVIDNYDTLEDPLDPKLLVIQSMKAGEKEENTPVFLRTSPRRSYKRSLMKYQLEKAKLEEQGRLLIEKENGVAAATDEDRDRQYAEMQNFLKEPNQPHIITKPQETVVEEEPNEDEDENPNTSKDSKKEIKPRKPREKKSASDFLKDQFLKESAPKKVRRRKVKPEDEEERRKREEEERKKISVDTEKANNLLNMLNSKTSNQNNKKSYGRKSDIDISKMNFVACTEKNEEMKEEPKKETPKEEYEYYSSYSEDYDYDDDGEGNRKRSKKKKEKKPHKPKVHKEKPTKEPKDAVHKEPKEPKEKKAKEPKEAPHKEIKATKPVKQPKLKPPKENVEPPKKKSQLRPEPTKTEVKKDSKKEESKPKKQRKRDEQPQYKKETPKSPTKNLQQQKKLHIKNIPKSPEPNSYVDNNGQIVDPSRKYKDNSGQVILLSNRQYVDPNGKVVQLKPGEYLNENGEVITIQKNQVISSNGDVIDLPAGQFINDNGQLVNEKGELINENGEVLKEGENPRYVDVNGHIKVAQKDGNNNDRQNNTLKANNNNIKNNPRNINKNNVNNPSNHKNNVPGNTVNNNDNGNKLNAVNNNVNNISKSEINENSNEQNKVSPPIPAIIDENGKVLMNLHINEDGKVVNEDGEVIENIYVDKQGHLVNENGQYVNSKGELVNATGKVKYCNMASQYDPMNDEPPAEVSEEVKEQIDQFQKAYNPDPEKREFERPKTPPPVRWIKKPAPPIRKLCSTPLAKKYPKPFVLPPPNFILDPEAVLALFGRGHTELLPLVERIKRDYFVYQTHIALPPLSLTRGFSYRITPPVFDDGSGRQWPPQTVRFNSPNRFDTTFRPVVKKVFAATARNRPVYTIDVPLSMMPTDISSLNNTNNIINNNNDHDNNEEKDENINENEIDNNQVVVPKSPEGNEEISPRKHQLKLELPQLNRSFNYNNQRYPSEDPYNDSNIYPVQQVAGLQINTSSPVSPRLRRSNQNSIGRPTPLSARRNRKEFSNTSPIVIPGSFNIDSESDNDPQPLVNPNNSLHPSKCRGSKVPHVYPMSARNPATLKQSLPFRRSLRDSPNANSVRRILASLNRPLNNLLDNDLSHPSTPSSAAIKDYTFLLDPLNNNDSRIEQQDSGNESNEIGSGARFMLPDFSKTYTKKLTKPTTKNKSVPSRRRKTDNNEVSDYVFLPTYELEKELLTGSGE